jgi:hypothetical protein
MIWWTIRSQYAFPSLWERHFFMKYATLEIAINYAKLELSSNWHVAFSVQGWPSAQCVIIRRILLVYLSLWTFLRYLMGIILKTTTAAGTECWHIQCCSKQKLFWRIQMLDLVFCHQIVFIQRVGTCLPQREGVHGPTQLLHTPLEGQVMRTRTMASMHHDLAQ